jgi:hypothetical protein
MESNEILFNTLEYIRKTKSFPPIISTKYCDSLVEIGFVDSGWDTILTNAGHKMLENLRSTYQQW